MTWFHKHAGRSFKLKCAPAASEMFKFLVEFKFQAVSTCTVIVMFYVAEKEKLRNKSFLTGSIY